MKFNINSYGKDLFNKIMSVLKPKLTNIDLRGDNGYLYFKDSDGIESSIDVDILTKTDMINYITANRGFLNVDPHGITGKDFDLMVNNYPNEAKLSREVTNGAYRSLSYNGIRRYILLSSIFPYYKYMKYRFVVDIKIRVKSTQDSDSGYVLLYGVNRLLDGSKYSYDNYSKLYKGSNIFCENTFFRGSDSSDVNTAYKYVLTREFKKNDEYLYFITDDINNWYLQLDSDGNVINKYQALKLHRDVGNGKFAYVGKGGKIHNHLGYSQDVIYGEIDEQDTSKAKDDPLRYFITTGNTVDGKPEYKMKIKDYTSLPYMWRGDYEYYPAGSIGLQTRGSGHTYLIAGRRVDIDNKWHTVQSEWIDLSNKDGLNDCDFWRDGTVFGRAALLFNIYSDNYQHEDLEFLICNVGIEYKNLD